jgi:hypothetical protein
MEPIEIKDKVKAVPIQSSVYGQAYAEKTPEDSRTKPCKDKKCGHPGTQHKFLVGYNEGDHNCYLCGCPNYVQ